MDMDEIPTVLNSQSSYSKNTSKIGSYIVPTLDEDVRKSLRNLGHPVTYFGEDNEKRRKRLIALLNEINAVEGRSGTNSTANQIKSTASEGFRNLDKNSRIDQAQEKQQEQQEEDYEEEEEEEEEFYTPGKRELIDYRKRILDFSLSRASERTKKELEEYNNLDRIKQLKHRRKLNAKISKFDLSGTQMITQNTRALSTVKFNFNDNLLAAGSWDGSIYILDASNLALKYLSGPEFHVEKVGSIDWQEKHDGLLVSGGNTGNINLWNVPVPDSDDVGKITPSICMLDDSGFRVTSTKFHPISNLVASTSFAYTWKLWDIQKPDSALLEQEGHSREVYCGEFNSDGSLYATGGLDGFGKVWDLRSGRCITSLRGHVKGIYSICWAPNSYQVVTASGDCSAKVWDLRKVKPNTLTGDIATIPCHSKLVSSVKFFSKKDNGIMSALASEVTDEYGRNAEILDSNGSFLITSSYDGEINVWSADNWEKLATLKGHTDKIMDCDINGQGNIIASCGWDRTVRIWSL